jgi:SRSO17 transposase
VSLSLANHHASLPVAYRLYLPKGWAEDEKRREKAGVPEEIEFRTKLEIARDQIEWAVEAGVPKGVVLMDAAYGTDASLRARIAVLGLQYAVAIRGRTLVAYDKKETSAGALAKKLPKRAWKTIAWRQGSAEPLKSRFARVRVRPCGDGCTADQPEEWMLIEWPKGEAEPTKFWLATMPKNIAFDALVDITMMRWRIERDYQELKQEVGLGHFEGRGWVGFHHHATMCIAAYGFLVSERAAFPPCEADRARYVARLEVPQGWRPRGSAAAA